MCWWSSLGGTEIEKAIDSAILSRRWIPLHGDSLATSLLSRRRFGLDGSPLLDFERSTEDLLSLSTADLSPRRFSRDVASLSPGLLSRQRFGLDGSPLLDFECSTEDLLSHRQRFTEYEGEEGHYGCYLLQFLLNTNHPSSYPSISIIFFLSSLAFLTVNTKVFSMETFLAKKDLAMKDLAMKEKLSKLAILDTLLAKKDPLSEAEEIVKNKLLTQYF
ncbi:hypothetical protein DY000_02058660 [Brassica cretica]|uniref:Uncharacterized protein n=1 Tax=Brassica cretica TaxID=69181 RepID=A0ABQ7AMU1_BRACR|nr:hypothetical protein DY000_02058660 [Brassica cretica]